MMLNVWRWSGYCITTNFASQPVDSKTVRWQLPLRDFLMLTAAVALLVAALRFVIPGARPLHLWIYVTVHGFSVAAVVLVATWAAFSSRSLVLRLAAGGIVTLVAGTLPVVAVLGNRVDPVWWCETYYAATVMISFLSLSIFRMDGFRIMRFDRKVTVRLPPR